MHAIAAFPNKQTTPFNPDVYHAIARHQPAIANAIKGISLKTRILHDGDSLKRADGEFYIVVSGCLKKTRMDSVGDAHIDGFYFPGNLICDDTTETSRCCVVTAYDTVCLAIIPVNVLFSSDGSDLSATIVRGLSDELTHANTLSFYVTKKNATVRLAWFLHTLWSHTKKRLGSTESGALYMPMSRADIASYLGLAAETVSREFSRLSRAALIAVDKRTVHINRSRDLARMAHINTEAPALH